METWLLGGAIAFCLLTLGIIARRDWPRLTRPSRQVTARVIRHHSQRDDGGISYAAVYGFSDETGQHEVTDQLLNRRPQPEIGHVAELVYPDGRPDLARPPRPAMWTLVYTLLLVLLAVLVAKAAGLLH